MSELAFTKSFISALDSRPIKLRADYVHDQGNTPRVPVRTVTCGLVYRLSLRAT